MFIQHFSWTSAEETQDREEGQAWEGSGPCTWFFYQVSKRRGRVYEEEWWQKQVELEKRRHEEMEHEERMMACIFQRPSPHNFNVNEYSQY